MKNIITTTVSLILGLAIVTFLLLYSKTSLFIIVNEEGEEIISLNSVYVPKKAKTLFNLPLYESGFVDTTTVGSYEISYCHIGNCKYKTVKVVDDTDPTITLNGNLEINIVMNENYIEPGYNAMDNYEGDITDKVEVETNLDSMIPGSYEIKYKVSDESNNKVMAKRIINVVEYGPMSQAINEFSLDGYFTNTILKETLPNDEYLKETIFFGDSITFNFAYYGNISYENIWAMSNVTPANAHFWNVMFFKYGREINIVDGFKTYKPKRVIITLGTNAIAIMDRGYFMEQYESLIIKLKEASPETQIIVQSITPVYSSLDMYGGRLNNSSINATNYLIAQMCERQNIKFLNTAEALKNANGTALEGYFYSGEGIHLLPNANNIVMNYVKSHCIDE